MIRLLLYVCLIALAVWGQKHDYYDGISEAALAVFDKIAGTLYHLVR